MRRSLLLLPLLVLLACGGEAPPAEAPSTAAPAAAAGQEVLRTGDPYARGLTDEDFPRIHELARNVYSYEQLRSAGDERFTTVSLFVVTPAGVLVADGQGSVEETQRMVDHIAEITDQPITHVVICSDHGDHTAGNSAFPSTAAFLAHPTSQAALEASRASAREGAPPVVMPTELVETSRTLDLGGTEIQVLHLGRAHTGGDLVVYLPAEKILFMSEAYLNRIFPAMRSAYPSEWVAMIERAQAMDVDVYVPGHGFVDSPTVLEEELETYKQAVQSVIAEARRHHDAGVSVDQAAEQATFGDLESWSLRSSQGATAIRRVYLELDGELPGASR
ncbi:MAG: MBL fold metallo-hydrolase [Gemmatimonadota bacterium]|nr:MBL fold metallo-hydrolase [Gemmatimonadota bacterium]